MNFLRRHRNQPAEPAFPPPPGRDYAPPLGPPPGRFDEPPPPEWAPAPEKSHADGLHADATRSDFKHGLAFCARYPLESPRLLPSTSVERIKERGAGAWQLLKPSHPYFAGTIITDNKSSLVGSSRVVTDRTCKDSCIMSDLPIVGGLYEYRGKRGVYFEVRVNKMDGTVAIGTTCKPYPEFRLPGWNRQSAALHLDDMRKFFEDPDGGRDYAPDISVHPGCVVGCGYDFASGVIFFTFNGQRLPDAFRGTYLPRDAYDVYAAIGFDGANDVEVNFGTASFAWKEANEWAWRLEGHVGQAIGAAAAGTSAGFYPPVGEDLPAYSRSSRPSAR